MYGRHPVLCSCMGCLLFTASPASAQLEEVIVTAQRREQPAHDIGLSISTFNTGLLHDLDVGGDISRIADQVSNSVAYATGNAIQSYFIRGIGLNEFAGNFDSPVATHVDEVYLSKSWMSSEPVFDMSRLEVLKGPQGTLFGRNSTGGVVNWYTNDPTRDFEYAVSAGIDGDQRYTGQGHVSGPLAGNLSGRLSFLIQGSDGGPWENLHTGEEIGRNDRQLLRGKLLWEGERTLARLMIHGGHDNSERPPWKSPGIWNDVSAFPTAGTFCPELLAGEVTEHPSVCRKFAGLAALGGRPDAEFEPEGTFDFSMDHWPVSKHDLYGGYLRVDHEVASVTLTSLTAYEYYERDDREDSDASPIESTNTDWYTRMGQFSQDFRIAGSFASDRWRYVAGLYYEQDDLREIDSTSLAANPLLPLLGIPPFAPRLANDFEQDTESVAVYVHNEYDFTDQVTINFGARGTFDRTQLQGLTALAFNDPQGEEDRVTPCLITTYSSPAIPPLLAPACAGLAPVLGLPLAGADGGRFDDERSDEDLSLRVGFDWSAARNWLVYLNFSSGYRGGGYNAPFGGLITKFRPEGLFAQEAGFKALLLGDTLELNAAAFQYQYDDIQVNVDDPASPLVPITRNIDSAQTRGIEADLSWVPNERWRIQSGIGYLDAEYERTPATITTYAGPVALQGKRPINTPKWTFNELVRYERPLIGGWNLILMSDFRWTDDRYLEASNAVFDKAQDYWLVNARGAIASRDGRWEMALWGKNVFNERYLTYINNISFFKLDIFGAPASFGATLTYRFP